MTHREATRDIRGATIAEVTIFRLQLKGVAPGGFEKKSSTHATRPVGFKKSLPFLFFIADLRAAQRGLLSSKADVSAGSYCDGDTAVIIKKER